MWDSPVVPLQNVVCDLLSRHFGGIGHFSCSSVAPNRAPQLQDSTGALCSEQEGDWRGHP